MDRKKGMLQTLSEMLLYPAFLGTIIYSACYFTYGCLTEAHGTDQSALLILIKTAMLLSVLWFYCCSYLYTIYSTNYGLGFFICDIVIVISLYATYRAIAFTEPDEPQLNLILLGFIIFMVVYFFWDYYEYKRTLNRGSEKEANFYKEMTCWELQFGLVFAILLVINLFVPKPYGYVMTILCIIGIVVSNFKFTLLLQEKYNLPGPPPTPYVN